MSFSNNKNKFVHIFPVGLTPYAFFQNLFDCYVNGAECIKIYCGIDHFSKKLISKYNGSPISVEEINYKRSNSIRCIFSNFFVLFKVLLRERDTIVVIHTPVLSFYICLISLIIKPKKLIFYCHGLLTTEKNLFKSNLFFIIEYFIFKKSDFYAFVSNSLMEFAVNKYKIDPKRILVTTNSICGVLSNDLVKSKVLDPRLVRIGYLGRLSNSKGLQDLIYIANSLIEMRVSFEFHIGGPIEDHDLFQKLLNFSDSVIYHGFVDDKMQFFERFDIFVFPSRREGFGLAALEANSFGLPVIGYNIVGLSDAISHNESGFLVNPYDVDLILDSIFIYVNNKSCYNYHSAAGIRRSYELFNPSDIAKIHFKALNMLL